MSIIGSILEIISTLADKIPLQGREERWKNNLDNLKAERKALLRGKWNVKKAERLAYLDRRIEYHVQLLKNRS